MRLPNAALVIIGGGVIGCAIAYHLAKAGFRDVLLIERGDPGGGTTAQSAGLIGQVRGSVEYTRLTMRSIEAFETLIAEGYDPGWHPVGSLRLSFSAERDAEFGRLIDISRQAGLSAEAIAPVEVTRRFPALRCDAVSSAIWCADDGYVEPRKLTAAYLAAAQRLGVQVATGVTVQGFQLDRASLGSGSSSNRLSGVVTDCADIQCETVINAAGTFAGKLAEMVGARLPIVPVRHELVICVPPRDIPAAANTVNAIDSADHPLAELPVIRVPERSAYIRPADASTPGAVPGSLIVGGFEPHALSYDPTALSTDFQSPPVPVNWPQLTDFVESLRLLLPNLGSAALGRVQKGWPTCTPDGEFVIGRLPGVAGFIMASGCNVHGVSGSAGIARLVVEAVLNTDLTTDAALLSLTSPSRFDHAQPAWTWPQARQAAESVYANYYSIKQHE